MRLLGNRTPAEFLDTYWQKKPLLIRDALPEFQSPLEPGELAGLAMEPGVQSRLILEEGGAHPWELREGPFEEDDFLSLPAENWTLLVQEVDRLLPDVGDLLDAFSFLPSWRLDDVMVSYAPTGGNVGAHIDNYDVFLVQGLGHRRWEIGHAPVEDETILPDLDVRILADFEPDEAFEVGPGDVLYLPPRVAHHGVATDDQCMTYSVGFRAPSHRRLVAGFLQHALDEKVDDDARYTDPDLTPPDHPGAIGPEARETVRGLLRRLTEDDDAIDRWLGQFLTEPQRGRMITPPDDAVTTDALTAAIRAGRGLRRTPAARLAFVEQDDGLTLFASGTPHDVPPSLADAARAVSGRDHLPASHLQPHLSTPGAAALWAELVNAGHLEAAKG